MSRADTALAADAAAGDTRNRRVPILLTTMTMLLILWLGLSLRLHAALETENSPPLQGDSVDYVSAAYNIRHFGVFSHENLWAWNVQTAPRPDALRGPGYPAMLALLMPGIPDQPFLFRALLLQVLLGVLTVATSFLLSAQLLQKWAALTVATLVAVSPQMISLGTSLLTETLFALLVTAGLCAIAWATLRRSVAWYGIAGLLIGMSDLVRPTLEFLPVLLVPALAWIVPHARWKSCLALLLGIAIAFGPWVVRNEFAIGAASDPTLMTNALLQGSYKDFMYREQPQSLGYAHRFDPRAAEVRTPGQAIARISDDFRSDPGGMLRWYLVSKPARLFDWDFVEGSGIFLNAVSRSPYMEDRREFSLSYAAMHFLHWPLIALCCAGIAIAFTAAARKERTAAQSAMAVLAAAMVFVIAMHVIGLPLGRYSVPFRPLTYLLAMHAIASVARWASARFR